MHLISPFLRTIEEQGVSARKNASSALDVCHCASVTADVAIVDVSPWKNLYCHPLRNPQLSSVARRKMGQDVALLLHCDIDKAARLPRTRHDLKWNARYMHERWDLQERCMTFTPPFSDRVGKIEPYRMLSLFSWSMAPYPREEIVWTPVALHFPTGSQSQRSVLVLLLGDSVSTPGIGTSGESLLCEMSQPKTRPCQN